MRSLTIDRRAVLRFAFLASIAYVSAIHATSAQTTEEHKNCITLSPPGKYPDYEPLPKYSVERREPSSPSKSGILLGISVAPDAVNSGSLTRLACKLGSDFSTQKRLDAYIFDDEKAARNLAIYYTEQRGYGMYLWHFKARYILDRSEGLEFIEYVSPTLEDGLLSLRRVKISLTRSPGDRSARATD